MIIEIQVNIDISNMGYLETPLMLKSLANLSLYMIKQTPNISNTPLMSPAGIHTFFKTYTEFWPYVEYQYRSEQFVSSTPLQPLHGI